MYKDFSKLYDQLMNDIDYKKWFNYIEEIFEKYKIEGKTILEMACGTGSLAYYFAEKDYRLTCFDISNEMLSIAQNKLSTFRNVKILNQNMIDFKFKEKYDCILATCDSINYIIEDRELISLFENVYNHLKEGGLFIFDINSQYKLKNIIGNNTFFEDQGHIFYIWDNDFQEKENIANFYLTFFHMDSDGKYERADEHHRERAYSIEEISNFLNLAKFNQIDIYDAFSFSKAKDDSERINFVVKK